MVAIDLMAIKIIQFKWETKLYLFSFILSAVLTEIQMQTRNSVIEKRITSTQENWFTEVMMIVVTNYSIIMQDFIIVEVN